MALALNNLKRIDMPLNKETKPNHLQYMYVIYRVINTGDQFSDSIICCSHSSKSECIPLLLRGKGCMVFPSDH